MDIIDVFASAAAGATIPSVKNIRENTIAFFIISLLALFPFLLNHVGGHSTILDPKIAVGRPKFMKTVLFSYLHWRVPFKVAITVPKTTSRVII